MKNLTNTFSLYSFHSWNPLEWVLPMIQWFSILSILLHSNEIFAINNIPIMLFIMNMSNQVHLNLDKFKKKKDVMKKDSMDYKDRDADDAVDLSADILWEINDMDGGENLIDLEEVNIAMESSKTLSFHERMKRLLPHCVSLKEWMKDQMISYVDLL